MIQSIIMIFASMPDGGAVPFRLPKGPGNVCPPAGGIRTDMEHADNKFTADAYYVEYKFIPQLLDLIKDRQISPKILVDVATWEKLIVELGGTIGGFSIEDIRYTVTKLSDCQILIIYIFPEPKAAPEAKYGAVVTDLKDCTSRYLTMELSAGGIWMLGSPGVGCHFNLGKADHELSIEEFGKKAVSLFQAQ